MLSGTSLKRCLRHLQYCRSSNRSGSFIVSMEIFTLSNKGNGTRTEDPLYFPDEFLGGTNPVFIREIDECLRFGWYCQFEFNLAVTFVTTDNFPELVEILSREPNRIEVDLDDACYLLSIILEKF